MHELQGFAMDFVNCGFVQLWICMAKNIFQQSTLNVISVYKKGHYTYFCSILLSFLIYIIVLKYI